MMPRPFDLRPPILLTPFTIFMLRQILSRPVFWANSARFASTNSQRPRNEQLVVDLVKELEASNSAHASSGGAIEGAVKLGDERHARPDLERLRVVPKDMSFYMENPPYEEVMRTLNTLLQRHINLPTVAQEDYQGSKWKAVWENDGKFRKRDFRAFSDLATRLDMIDPQLMPSEVEHVLDHLRSQGSDSSSNQPNRPKIPPLDQNGIASAVGRRKTSNARVQVVRAKEDTVGQVLINGAPLTDYFPNLIHREKITYPLRVIEASGAFNIFATVQGGGITGQADAVANAIGLALRMHNPLLGLRLKKAGCIKPDLRQKERKKPGLAKARKAYTWVKR